MFAITAFEASTAFAEAEITKRAGFAIAYLVERTGFTAIILIGIIASAVEAFFAFA